MYTRFYNVLNEDQQKTCLDILEQPTWGFAGRSIETDLTFWYKELKHIIFFNEEFFNIVKKLIKDEDVVIERLYANGQTFGLSGSLHQDDSGDNSFTFVYYANPYWEPQWGGDTVFYSPNGEHEIANFIPNTGIIFKGNIFHAGLEPTRHFVGLRMTVAFKIKKKDKE
jgi:hypothetical protein